MSGPDRAASGSLSEGALEIVQRLRAQGRKAFWAGGCVRDMVRGEEPQDYDVATGARPEEIQRLFPHTVAVGAQFGVVVVLLGERRYEVATFRREGPYRDGRHPESVTFTDEMEDVRRRDFTVNALLYDPLEGRVIDHVGGEADIAARIVRTVGPPAARFEEDHLRLLRAVRFAAHLGYAIEEETRRALVALAPRIATVSAERVRDELVKILTGRHPHRGIALLHDLGLLPVVLPEVEALDGIPQPPEFHPEGDVFTHTLLMLEKMESPSAVLALGVLLHDIGKPPTYQVTDRIRFNNHTEVGARMARAICERLRLSRDETDRVEALVRDHLRFMSAREMRPSTLKRFLKSPHFDDHLELHRLDCLASHGDLSTYEFCRAKLDEIAAEPVPPRPLITGDDLIAMGFQPGPLFREILTRLQDEQLEGRLTDPEEARAFVEREYGERRKG